MTSTTLMGVYNYSDVYSSLESVTQENEVIGYTYNTDGTLQFSSVGSSTQNEKVDTEYKYDGLKRLTSVTQNTTGTDPNISNLLIQYNYDVNDRLTTVMDPKNGTTTYVYDDLGNLLSQTSPDTGLTSFVSDNAGNRTQQTDANQIILKYSYDGLNRIKSINSPVTSDNISVIYDSCLSGLGRLCNFTDVSGNTSYQYDGFGRTKSQSHTEFGVSYKTSYVYNLLDRITQITLPTGRIINKKYNANNQVYAIDATVAGTMSVLIDNASYDADGQLSGFKYGNGYIEKRNFDLTGRIITQNMPDIALSVVPDKGVPLISVQALVTREATATLTPVTLIESATDDVDGMITPTPSNAGPFPLGNTSITWTATDAAGNSSTALQTISIIDTSAPIITSRIINYLIEFYKFI